MLNSYYAIVMLISDCEQHEHQNVCLMVIYECIMLDGWRMFGFIVIK